MPDFVSDLKIGAKIGSGHFGDVYGGVDPAHGDVAVKVLSRKAQDDDATWKTYKDNALSEAKHLSKATHPNVVKVHHVVEKDDGESVFICMEYCGGGSLEARFDAGPMNLADVKKATTEVLLGLSALHARKMIHRDIKPGNILLDGNGVAKLSDFGLVTDDLLQGYASHAGYLDHMAFELWNGEGTSIKSDIWALGMTVYRLLHGKAWYEAQQTPKYVIRDGSFAKSLKWLPHVPKGWRSLLRKMMNDDTTSRYQSAAQVLRSIANLSTFPTWETTVTPAQVRWTRTKGARRIIVEWDRHSARKHEWKAWSEPTGNGNVRTLGGSNGIVGSGKAVAELERFFATAT